MIKMVTVVRKDLHMRAGKAIAQAQHAVMKIFFDKKSINTRKDKNGEILGHELNIQLGEDMYQWVTGIFTKICVYVNSEEELLAIKAKADALQLPTALVEDNGLTEFHGQLTKTVLAIGPAESSLIDPITGALPLL